MEKLAPWLNSAVYIPRPRSRANQSIAELIDTGSVEGYFAYRDWLDTLLARVPDDLRVESQRQWRGGDDRVSTSAMPESASRTKHIVRSSKGLFPGSGNFVADILLNDRADRGASGYKPEAMHADEGDALIHLMVEAPKIIRRLLAYIDDLEGQL